MANTQNVESNDDLCQQINQIEERMEEDPEPFRYIIPPMPVIDTPVRSFMIGRFGTSFDVFQSPLRVSSNSI